MAPVIKVLQDPEASSTCNDQTCSRWKPYSNSKDFERDAWLILGILFGVLFFGIGIHAAVCCIIRRRRVLRQANSGGVVISFPSTELNSSIARKPISASGGDAVEVKGEVLVFNPGYDKNCCKLTVDCAICLSEFEEGDRVMVLEGCKHGFHVNCIKEWLSAHSSCPICRAITSASSSSVTHHGEKGGSSWLSLVKKAFSSPSKVPDTKINNRRKDEHDQQEKEEAEEEKKREKKRWLFRRPTCGHSAQPKLSVNAAQPATDSNLSAEQRHAIAVAAATAAAAEAAVATAQAAVEIIRLTRPPVSSSVQSSNSIRRDHYAATVIQTAFRGYLARRALQALRGIVKLQALVRGHNVRKQAKSTLKCMEALLRVQSRVRDQRARLSHEGSRKSTITESNNQWESSKYYPPQEIRDRKSMSRTRSSLADDWDECPHTLEQLDALLQARKEAALRHERTAARAMCQQVWDSGRSPSAEGIEREIEERANWLDQWMASKQWESYSRDSSERREPIKTVEMDMSMPHRYSSSSVQRPQSPHIQNQRQHASPRHRAAYHQPSVTPSPSKIRPVQVRSASPRCFREEQNCSTANNTPSLVTSRRLSSYLPRQSETSASAAIPNYMTATESAKARLRSQSAPRQRPSTPEKERSASAKKRLSYPVPEPYYSSTGKNLRSPSFKSVQAGYVGMELGSNMSSCYTESIGGELSPCSTTDLRRWFK